MTADRPGVCVHAAAHPQPKGLAASTRRAGTRATGGFFEQTFLLRQLPACSSAANGILGCNQCSRFDGNVNDTSRWGACVECRKRHLLISHFVCGGPAEDSKVRYCCCRIDLLDDVCLVSRPPFVKTRKLVLCRSAGHHRERSHPCLCRFVLLPSLRTFSALRPVLGPHGQQHQYGVLACWGHDEAALIHSVG